MTGAWDPDRLAEALRRPNISRARDARESPMAKLPQVLDGLGYGSGVIDPDAAQVAFRTALIEDHRRDVM